MNQVELHTLRTHTFVFALASALFLGWRCITLGMTDLHVASDPEAAIGWRVADPAAQYNLAQADFLAHRYRSATAHARLAGANNPLDGRSYRVLAGIAEAAGNTARAKGLFKVAERRAPRDLPTRIKLAGYAFKDGDLARAVHEVDMLLRMQPELGAKILPGLARLSEEPEAVDPIASALSHAPSWRDAFFSLLSSQARSSSVVDRIFARIAGNGGLSADELALRRSMQQRTETQPLVLAAHAGNAIATQDWFALMGWEAISRNAYLEAEGPFETVGMP